MSVVRKLSCKISVARALCVLSFATAMVDTLLIGYARATVAYQTPNEQLDALSQAGCERIFLDEIKSGQMDREGLAAALSLLGPGDALIVFRLDRLGQSVRQLIKLMIDLSRRNVEFRSLRDGIDTGELSSCPFIQTIAALFEMERSLTQERTRVGRTVARARGREGGRHPKLNIQQIEHAKSLLADPAINVTEVAARLGVARSTLYRAMERASASGAE